MSISNTKVKNQEHLCNREYSDGSCPECGGNATRDGRETYCQNCGLVIAEKEIDRGPEWRAFDAHERNNKSHVGAPLTELRHDRGLSTQIGRTDSTPTASQRRRIKRLRTWHKRTNTQSKKDRNLIRANQEIKRMCSALGLGRSVRERAARLHKRAADEGMLEGRTVEGVSTAAVLVAGRETGRPLTVDDLEDVSQVGRSEIWNGLSALSQHLEIGVQPILPKDYLPQFIQQLVDCCNGREDLRNLEQTAREILNRVSGVGKSGKSPRGIAAAAIRHAAAQLDDVDLTQKEIAEIANVDTKTVRKQRRDLLKDATAQFDQQSKQGGFI